MAAMRKMRPPRISGRKAAAALRYKTDMDIAPRVVAKGMGAVAERIIRAAEEAGVPVHENADLCALLMTVSVNDVIPPDMYVAVAEVLAFIYRINAGKTVGG